MKLNADAIQREIEAGYVYSQRHPQLPLQILNYTQRAQYDWHWNEVTKQCRGLIVDDQWNVVARPFEKFFSYEQLGGEVPDEPFTAFEKLDGSLGILYYVDGLPAIATRGSFVSWQADAATDILLSKYWHVSFDPALTYLFEIILPENRIVVDYGQTRDVILLAVIETATGRELPLPHIGLPTVKRYDGIRIFDDLLSHQDPEREGFVVRFESGFRVKVKFEEYKRLHRLLTGISPKAIWDAIRSGQDLDSLIDRVPDEFYRWFRSVESDLRSQYAAIESEARSAMRTSGSRKELAAYFQSCRYPAVMFAMLDGREYSDIIWKMLRPTGAAFRCDAEV